MPRFAAWRIVGIHSLDPKCKLVFWPLSLPPPWLRLHYAVSARLDNFKGMMFKIILPQGFSPRWVWGKWLKKSQLSRLVKNFNGSNFPVFLLLLIPFGLGGCHMVSRLPAVNLKEPGWIIQEGQAVWRQKADAPEIAGEFLIATPAPAPPPPQFPPHPLPLVT